MAWMALNNQAGEQLLLITATTVHRRSYRAALLHDQKKKKASPSATRFLVGDTSALAHHTAVHGQLPDQMHKS